MKSMFPVLLCILLSLSSTRLSADAVRGTVVEILEITTEGEANGSCHIEELVSLQLGEGSRFFTGIELKLTIPEELMRFRNSFAVYLYRNIDPAPEMVGMRRYFGESLAYYVLPASRSMYIQIPLRENADLPISPETSVLKSITAPDEYPLLLTILPIMKGIPSDIYSATFELSAYPYIADEGLLELTIDAPGAQAYTLLIDGKRHPYSDAGYRLSGGIHEISIESPAYLPLKRKISITKGSSTALNLSLEKRDPRVFFEVPEGTLIFLDGERLNGTSLKVAEGTHTVVFKLGDYSMTKEFEVTGGKSYTITLFFDIFVKEN